MIKHNTILLVATALMVAVAPQPMSGTTQFDEGLVFRPVTHCRIADTRVDTILTCHPANLGICVHTISTVSAWLVAGDETRVGFKDLTIPFSFAEQGGNPSGCDVPSGAKAVVLNIAVNPIRDTAGHLRVWKYETAGHIAFNGSRIPSKPPKASELNWPADSATWTNSTVTVEICDPETANFGDCNEDILIQPFGSPVRLVIDVQGYFR